MAKKTQSSPKNAKAAEARAKAQAQMRAQERRSSVMIWTGVVVALALFGALIFFIVQQGEGPDLNDPDAVPAGSTADGGIPVGTEGVVGQDVPEDAPRVDIYADFLCPVCGQFEAVNGEDLNALREDGTIALYYHPVSILDRASAGSQYSTRAASAVATVADEAPENFLAFYEALFANQPTEGGAGLSDEQIEQIALDSGVPEDVASTLDDGRYRGWAAVATQQASRDGMQGTPTVMVDGEILDQAQVAYFQPGALRSYLESYAESGEATGAGPGGSTGGDSSPEASPTAAE